MKEEKKKVTDDTLVKNKLGRWKPIFYCQKPPYTPPKVCEGSNTLARDLQELVIF
jgi:hypothetical protein